VGKPKVDPPLPLGMSADEFAAVRDYLAAASFKGLTTEETQNQRLLAEVVGLLRRISDQLTTLIAVSREKK
jgi:hypothetical protein